MKLIFIKNNVVVNTVVSPTVDLQSYEKSILEKGFADSIIHADDDIFVGMGFIYDGKNFSSPIDDGVKTSNEDTYTVDRDNVDEVTDNLITK